MKRIPELASLVALLLIATAVACQRTPDDLEQWRNAKHGMQKMQEWATSSEESRAVRIRAVEILVEEGRANTLKPTLEDVKDKKLRADMVDAAVPVVQKMWDAQDMPELSDDVKDQGGAVRAGASEAVRAKDAAFFLVPYARKASKKKLQNILRQWMSKEWQLRNKLGSTTLGQIAPRAGQNGFDNLIVWLKEAVRPHAVADSISRHGDDAAKAKAATVLRKRAEEKHPDLGPSLTQAVLAMNHSNLTPYFKKAITDPKTSKQFVDASMDAVVRIEGKRSAPYFSDLVTNKQGLLRWVAATRLVEVLGKPAMSYVGTGLPVEMASYPPVDKAELKDNTAYFCNMYHGAMQKADESAVADQLNRGLRSSRWPARVLALQCARIFKAQKLKDAISKLDNDDQKIPGWGKEMSVGELAQSVLEDLSKS